MPFLFTFHYLCLNDDLDRKKMKRIYDWVEDKMRKSQPFIRLFKSDLSLCKG